MAKNDKKIQKFCEELENEINKLDGTKQNRDDFIEFLYRNREIFQNEALFDLLLKEKLNFDDNKKIELVFIAQTFTRIELLKDLYLSHTHKTYIKKNQFNFLKKLNNDFTHIKTSKFLNNLIPDDEREQYDNNHFAKFIEQEVEANYPKDYAKGIKGYPITYKNLHEKMQDFNNNNYPNLLPDEIYHFILLTWQIRYAEIITKVQKCKNQEEMKQLIVEKTELNEEYNIIKQFKCYNQTQLEQKPSPMNAEKRKTLKLQQLGETITEKQSRLKNDTKSKIFLILNTLGILIIGAITIALAATGVLAPLSFITAKLGVMFFASHPIMDALAQGIIAMFITGLPVLAFTLINYFDRPRGNRQQKAKQSAENNPDEESLLDSKKDPRAKHDSLVVKVASDNEGGKSLSQDESEHSDGEESKQKQGSGFIFDPYRKHSSSPSTPPATSLAPPSVDSGESHTP